MIILFPMKILISVICFFYLISVIKTYEYEPVDLKLVKELYIKTLSSLDDVDEPFFAQLFKRKGSFGIGGLLSTLKNILKAINPYAYPYKQGIDLNIIKDMYVVSLKRCYSIPVSACQTDLFSDMMKVFIDNSSNGMCPLNGSITRF